MLLLSLGMPASLVVSGATSSDLILFFSRTVFSKFLKILFRRRFVHESIESLSLCFHFGCALATNRIQNTFPTSFRMVLRWLSFECCAARFTTGRIPMLDQHLLRDLEPARRRRVTKIEPSLSDLLCNFFVCQLDRTKTSPSAFSSFP